MSASNKFAHQQNASIEGGAPERPELILPKPHIFNSIDGIVGYVGPVKPNYDIENAVDVRHIHEAIIAYVEEKFEGVSAREKEIALENVQIALSEAAQLRRLKKALAPQLSSEGSDLPPPVRELNNDEVNAIKQVGILHPWESRDASDTTSAVDWVRKHYSAWIPGLLTIHLRQADAKLYGTYMKYIERTGRPPGLDIPTRDENDLRLKGSLQRGELEMIGPRIDAIGREWRSAQARTYYRQKFG